MCVSICTDGKFGSKSVPSGAKVQMSAFLKCKADSTSAEANSATQTAPPAHAGNQKQSLLSNTGVAPNTDPSCGKPTSSEGEPSIRYLMY